MSNIHPSNYRFLQEHIRRQSGIVLDEGKGYLVEARLLPLVQSYGLNNLDDLCNRLRVLSDLSLQRKFVEAMTTNETFFFREAHHFEALRTKVLPELISAGASERKLRLWSAAASCGQEAYSLAMLICEMGLDSWEITILGTDISSVVLERASAGIYSQLEIDRGLSRDLRNKYFTQRATDRWEAKPMLRKMVKFQPFDLRFNIRNLEPVDIAFCRNVLIYFDSTTKTRILEDIGLVMKPDRYLFLGGSEVSMPVGPRFQPIVLGETTFFKSLPQR